MSNWYVRMFEGPLGEYWLSVSDKRKEVTDLEISFLKDFLEKRLTLDHCCGPCRVSIPLSFYGPIVGLDLSRCLLTHANMRAKQANARHLYLIRADMRYLPFKGEVFDNVVNLWTSFGYFSEEENELVLDEIVRVLKNHGLFILDIANPGWLIRNFKEKDWDEDENYFSLQQHSVDWKNRRWKARWVVIDKRRKEIYQISFDHRLYSLDELKELLSKHGIVITQVYGSFKKEGFSEEKSSRIIILGRKR